MRRMRWDCSPDKDGCFNEKMRVKLGVFDDCFPGNIGFGDIDGIVEINGFCMMLEWKGAEINIPIGQRIMFERITKDPKFTVLVVQGNAENMQIQKIQLWFNGKAQKWMEADLAKTRNIIKRWAKWTKQRHI